ncbi:MAG: hypothetical protein QOG89_1549, partial [Thermomicrobiales bacterium]|nr:hypothetical protein [Thermomicrobiales bacterium]
SVMTPISLLVVADSERLGCDSVSPAHGSASVWTGANAEDASLAWKATVGAVRALVRLGRSGAQVQDRLCQ